jgi:DNA-binding MarR family transcriptional regulator
MSQSDTERINRASADIDSGEPNRESDGLDLDTALGYLLKQAASVLHVEMDAVLRPLGITITHYACLELLAQRPGLSNSDLARGTFVTRQSMNTLLQSMQRDGLVTRPDRPAIGRILPTELTALGRQQLKSASAAVRAVEYRMRDGLDTNQQNQLRHYLRSCIDSLADQSAS